MHDELKGILITSILSSSVKCYQLLTIKAKSTSKYETDIPTPSFTAYIPKLPLKPLAQRHANRRNTLSLRSITSSTYHHLTTHLTNVLQTSSPPLAPYDLLSHYLGKAPYLGNLGHRLNHSVSSSGPFPWFLI